MKIIYYDEKYLKPCAELLMKHYNNNDFGCKFTKERACAYLQEHIFKPRFIGFLLLEEEKINEKLATDEKLIGFAFCHIRTWSDTDDIYIDEFIIEDIHQNKGLGTKLLTFINTYATSFSLTGITTTTNVIALTQFYQKNDFLEHDVTFLYRGLKELD